LGLDDQPCASSSAHGHRSDRICYAPAFDRLCGAFQSRFQRDHRRHGHLFQNRYKSILCEEDRYLKQLVAYIHLNPVRAGIVEDVAALTVFAYTGYSALMGKRPRPWQDTDYVLGFFGERLSGARRNLEAHVRKWSAKGSRHELTGGGLIRSAGGWRAVKEAYRDGIRLASDERILGSSEFVEATLKNAGELYERRMRMQSTGIDLSAVIAAACRYLRIEEKELARPTRRVEIARARALISYVATQSLSISGSEVARRFNVDRSAISRATQRVSQDPELPAATKTIQRELELEKNN
jgi:putative transposase